VSQKQAIFRRVFGTTEGQIVLADLMEFANWKRNRFYEDPRWAERISGREDMVIYVLDSCGLPDDHLAIVGALLSVPVPKPEEQPEEAEG
jgi:hypothetical protein